MSNSTPGVGRGSIIVEFAMMLLPLMLLALGVAEASAAWRIKGVLTTAAFTGARAASVTPNLQENDAAILELVDAVLAGLGVDPSTSTRTVRVGMSLQIGDPVTVEVMHEFEPTVLGLIPAVPDTIRLASSSTMRFAPGTGITSGE